MAEVTHTVAGTEVPEEHQEPTALGFSAGGWVALAMVVVIAVMIWKKVPAAVAKALDDKIGAIRSQLAEAQALREEAEKLRKEYQTKARAADKEAAAMLERAQSEAEAIVAKAHADAEAMVERRTRMAEEKIAAEERNAINELRASAAAAASRAAEKLIAERHDAAADARLVDQAISGLSKGA
jgi:F-type H+-transporting ATPase subunit b